MIQLEINPIRLREIRLSQGGNKYRKEQKKITKDNVLF